MVLAPTFYLAGGVYFVRVFMQRIGLPLRQSLVQDLADPTERATGRRAIQPPRPRNYGWRPGLRFAGYLVDEVGLGVPFELAALFQCANAVLYELSGTNG
ncbi:MAG: hypothetical protein ACRDYY_17215 [Acidimicrobiales bacterium]